MKKFLKTFFAVLLSVAVLSGCISAFAAEENSKLVWNYYGSEYIYDIAGEITVGTSSLSSPEDSYNFCFALNVEESGYYTIGFSDYSFDGWIGIPEEVNENSASGESEFLYGSSEDKPVKYTYKLDKGVTYICFDAYAPFENQSFTVTGHGKSMESIDIDSSLIHNRDIYFYDGICEIYTDSVITFSSGSTTTVSYLCAEAPDGYKKGASTVRYSLFGENVDVEINVVEITDIITDVEVSNIEDYLNTKVYYDGYEGCLPLGETVTFTFSDGSKAKSEYENYGDNYVILPDGSEIFYHFYTSDDGNGNITLYIESAGTDIKAYDCKETKATYDENLVNLLTNEKYNLGRISKYLRQSLISLLECDSFEELKDYGFLEWSYNVQLAVEYFLDLFREITALIHFYIG